MQIIEDGNKYNINSNTYIALGSFDGLHAGHMQLIEKTIKLSRENNAKSMVYTFKNHPRGVINKDMTPKLLMDNDTKIKVLDELGVDILNFITFDKNFMKVSPDGFVLNLINNYNAKGIIVGFNYRFGYKNLGDVTLLNELSRKYNFHLYVIEPVKYNNELVSSSNIRRIISESGEMNKVNRMLTRPFSISGNVVEGRQIGRTIGFPTVNLDYSKNFIIPRGGVYFTIVQYKNDFYKGVTNIGYNPTVKNNKLSLETHILNFHKSVYNEEIRIYFIDRIRDEKKFNSLDELKIRINEDKKYVEKQNLELIVKNNLQQKGYLL
ncbi:bifunctional riboflavin kinase/FAD synthetase [Clostridium rectalis]|uniref:bifunctional riboflavin kinase/FAD synthetase n=1 Tax=Clostridium rectalis TaxID=2040295 RepID=UPI000F642158|nr:bifunctional riboflavin kinase/FAD synthetase [Clostridium rectalis]